MNLAPFPLFFGGAVIAVTARDGELAMVGFLAFGVGLFLIGLMLGLGRYRMRGPHGY